MGVKELPRLLSRVGSEDELNNVIRHIEDMLEDVKKVAESRVVGLDMGMKGISDCINKGMDWMEGELGKLSVATNQARDVMTAKVASISSTHTALNAVNTTHWWRYTQPLLGLRLALTALNVLFPRQCQCCSPVHSLPLLRHHKRLWHQGQHPLSPL